MIRIVERLAGRLPADERDAVLGDLAESGAGNGEAAIAIVGLVVRRQALIWKTWQPWIALLGIACLVGVLQSEVTGRLAGGIYLQARTYLRYGVHYSTGLTLAQDIAYLVCLFLAMCVWSWTSGFVLGRLSGRAIWFTAPFYVLVCLDSFPARMLFSGAFSYKSSPGPLILLWQWMSPFHYNLAPLLIPAIWGIWRGRRDRMPEFRAASCLATATTILTLLVIWTASWRHGVMERWSEGAMRGGPATSDFPLLLACWPALYMVWISRTYRRHSEA